MVMDDTKAPLYSASVLSFGAKTIAADPGAVNAFVTAWMKAAQDINADPESFRPLMLKKIRVPKNVHHSFIIPPFPINTRAHKGPMGRCHGLDGRQRPFKSPHCLWGLCGHPRI